MAESTRVPTYAEALMKKYMDQDSGMTPELRSIVERQLETFLYENAKRYRIVPNRNYGWYVTRQDGSIDISVVGTKIAASLGYPLNGPRALAKTIEDGRTVYYYGGNLEYIYKYDSNWDNLGTWGTFGNPYSGKQYYQYITGLTIDHARRRVWIAMGSLKIVRCFDLDQAGDCLVELGVLNQDGSGENGRLSYPMHCAVIEDGSEDGLVAVCNRDGSSEISVWNAKTGTWLHTPIKNRGNGFLSTLEAYSPLRIFVTGNQLWVANSVRQEVGCVKITDADEHYTSNWKFQRSYLKNRFFTYYNPTTKAIAITDQAVFAAYEGEDAIFKFNRATNDYEGKIGVSKTESAASDQTLGAFQEIVDIIADDEKKMIIALDATNQRVQELHYNMFKADGLEHIAYESSVKDTGVIPRHAQFKPRALDLDNTIAYTADDVLSGRVLDEVIMLFPNL